MKSVEIWGYILFFLFFISLIQPASTTTNLQSPCSALLLYTNISTPICLLKLLVQYRKYRTYSKLSCIKTLSILFMLLLNYFSYYWLSFYDIMCNFKRKFKVFNKFHNPHKRYISPLIHFASCISLGMIVTCFVHITHKFDCSKSPTRKASPASCKAIIGILWNCKSTLIPCEISLTALWNGNFLIKVLVLDWYFLISLRASTPYKHSWLQPSLSSCFSHHLLFPSPVPYHLFLICPLCCLLPHLHPSSSILS